MPDERQELQRLREAIARYDVAYYVDDRPLVSDDEYDALFQRLLDLETAHPEWVTPDSPSQRVGTSPAASFNAVPHRMPMLSLANAYSETELAEFDARIRALVGQDRVRFVAEPKLDGLSVEVTYEAGILVRASTRGDGVTGEDVTANVRTVKAIPLRLPAVDHVPSLLEVRGEVYIEKVAFRRVNEERLAAGLPAFANPRNLAAGSLRQLDSRVTAQRPLRAYFYDIGVADGLALHSQQELLAALHRLGLPVNPTYVVCEDVAGVLAFYRDIERRRDDLPYETDGIVVKVDAFDLRRTAGTVSRSPRWAIAGKFAGERAVTRLLDIAVQVGRTGVLTPVATLDPVRVRGVEIASATLHNEDDVRAKDLRIGDRVVVTRAGDVIPRVERSLPEFRDGSERPFVMPSTCPACASPVVRLPGETARRCLNTSCPARIRQSILHFVSRAALDVEGIGERLATQLVDRGLVLRLGDLFRLRRDALLELDRMGEASAKRVLASLERAKETTLERLVYGLGIPDVGATGARLLARRAGTLDRLRAFAAEDVEAIPTFGPSTARAVVEFFANEQNREALDDLLAAGVRAAPPPDEPSPSGPLAGRRIVFTGTLTAFTRAEAEQRASARGALVTSSVSRSTAYVVAGVNPGDKATLARKLGIPIVTEEEFRALLEDDA